MIGWSPGLYTPWELRAVVIGEGVTVLFEQIERAEVCSISPQCNT